MVSYEKLFKKLNGYDGKEIKRFLGINDSTLTKLYYNQKLSPNILKKISSKLNCQEQQIVTKKQEHDFVPVAQPFIKWVGGKRQLYNEIEKLIPKSYNNYIEPFVGGGAVLYLLHPKKAIINDYNYELITTYQQVANNLESLKKLLKRYEKQHVKNPQEFYLKIRELDKNPGLDKLSELEIAARFIYLNKAGFNGMYRVNKSGFFNVPWNQKEIVNTFDDSNLNKVCNYFNENKIKMYNADFEKIIEKAKPGDFIYIDPPYDYITDQTFDQYNENGFGKEDQIRLANACHRLHEKGCMFLLSNHNTGFIKNLYKGYNINIVHAKRMINSNASKRSGCEEVLIYNYPKEVTND